MKLVLPDALHARPADLLVRVARSFASSVTVVRAGKRADAKSILDVLALGAALGDTVDFEIAGEDAEACAAAVERLVRASFDADLVPDTGAAGSPGIAIGRAVVLEDDAAHGAEVDVAERFAAARASLASLLASLPPHERALFAPEAGILDELEPRIARRVASGEPFADAVLAETQVTASDLFLDARGRLLGGASEAHLAKLAALAEDAIVIAASLAPSLVAALPARVVGIVSGIGDEAHARAHGTGDTSHAAILARSRGIPLAFVADDVVGSVPEGDRVVLDTTTSPARVWVEPSERLLEDARARRDAIASEARAAEERAAALAARSPVAVRVNLSRADERIPAAAAGVGLVRTELVFAAHRSAPTEDEQAAAYGAIARAAAGRPVTIRLFDAGGDKPLAWLASPDPELRGAALLFAHEAALSIQLRAIARARAEGDARALLPLARDAGDVARVRALAPAGLPIGAMIETRGAAAAADAIADVADFVSLGTNDLTASILGAARGGAERGLDPAVWAAIEGVVRAARARGKDVTVCGELAAHPEGSRRLAAIGVSALSVAVPAFARVLEGVAGGDR